MRYRTLPRTDISVSEVGFGVWTLATGWWGEKDDREAVELLRAALDRGITLFDTADSYGNGRGETLLAQAFEGRRDDVVYSTKVGYDWYSHTGPRGQRELPHDWTPAFVRHSCERSLERLGTDRIDVYQLHNPRMDAIRSDELFATLEDLVDEGKVRSYGVGLGPKIGWRDEGLAALSTRPITSLTMIHNVLEQDPGRDLIAGAREAETGLFVRVPHSSGMLEGKYTTETTFPPSDHRSHRPRSWLLEGLQKIEALGFLTHERPHTLAQASLKWLLAEPLVMTTLPNIYGPEQLHEFAAAPDLPDLDEGDLARVAELYAEDFGVRPETETPAPA
jgi:aryl-alcohol dehydrogenase-like predicted oxidoreductase